uniref:Putative beta-D-xylosidase 2 n=1 Tax=Aegilops tauschii TaxID=37682 RepID=N1QP51_AEGTA
MPWKKSEALHGLSSRGPATKFDDPAKPHLHSGRAAVYNGVVFANVMNSTASFNETLSKSIGCVDGGSCDVLQPWQGRADVLEPQHQPAARPALETPGEGPFVVGRYAVNFVRGMQDILGHDTAADPSPGRSRRRRAASTTPPTISTTGTATPASSRRARPGARDMVETFLRPFEMCVRDGDVSSVMCSYNRVSGIPACADARLLSQTIRGEWQFHGYIVSDCEAVRVMVDNVTWLGYTAVKGSAAVLKAGLDLNCGES